MRTASSPTMHTASSACHKSHPVQPVDLSVVIVSYNTRELLARCLSSLTSSIRSVSCEVIVVDNDSRDGTVAMLRTRWPDVRLIATGGNLGFGRAANKGLALAEGRYCLLLNSDTECLHGALDELVAFLDSTPQAGVAAPRLLNSDGTDQATARAFPSPAAGIFGRKSLLTRLFPNNRWSARYLVGKDRPGPEPFDVDWVSGAALMVRREIIERVGPLDPAFFLYWEDADWCRRIGSAGHGIYCVPRAQVIHQEGGSGIAGSPRLVLAFHQSVYHYYVKHHAQKWWNPLRPLAAVLLFARAVSLMLVVYPLRARGGDESAPSIDTVSRGVAASVGERAPAAVAVVR